MVAVDTTYLAASAILQHLSPSSFSMARTLGLSSDPSQFLRSESDRVRFTATVCSLIFLVELLYFMALCGTECVMTARLQWLENVKKVWVWKLF